MNRESHWFLSASRIKLPSQTTTIEFKVPMAGDQGWLRQNVCLQMSEWYKL